MSNLQSVLVTVTIALAILAGCVAGAVEQAEKQREADRMTCEYVNFGWSMVRCYDPATGVTCYRTSSTPDAFAMSCLVGRQ